MSSAEALAALTSMLGDVAEVSADLTTRRTAALAAGTGEVLPASASDQVPASGAPIFPHCRAGASRRPVPMPGATVKRTYINGYHAKTGSRFSLTGTFGPRPRRRPFTNEFRTIQMPEAPLCLRLACKCKQPQGGANLL
jgi:hypothetical protein